MRHLVIGIALLTLAGCTEPTPFERDSPHDFEGTNYIPTAPEYVQIRQEDGAAIRVTWSNRAQLRDGVEVERSIDSSDFEHLLVADAETTSFVDQSTEMGTYEYRLRTVFGDKVSAWAVADPISIGLWTYASTRIPVLQCRHEQILPISNSEISVFIGSTLYTFNTHRLVWSEPQTSPVVARATYWGFPYDIHKLPQGGVFIVSGEEFGVFIERWNTDVTSISETRTIGTSFGVSPMVQEMRSAVTDAGNIIIVAFSHPRENFDPTRFQPQFMLYYPGSRKLEDLTLSSEISSFPLSMVSMPNDEILFVHRNGIHLYDFIRDTWHVLDLPELKGFSTANSFHLSDGRVYLQRENGSGVSEADIIFDPGTRTITEVGDRPEGPMIQMDDGRVIAVSYEMESLVVLDSVASTWNRIGELPKLIGPVRALGASPDGRLYAIGHEQGRDGQYYSNNCQLVTTRPI